jgi:hypothetical protein
MPANSRFPIAARSTIGEREPRNIRELKKQKKAIMLAAAFDSEAFSDVQDEIDYALRGQRP